MTNFTNDQRILTRRESEIAELLSWGATKKEIANRLYISPRTVENTARNIYEKTGVHSVGQLSAWYFCTRFCINPLLSPLVSVLFLLLVSVNELNDDRSSLRRVKARTGVVKVKSKRNRNDESNEIV